MEVRDGRRVLKALSRSVRPEEKHARDHIVLPRRNSSASVKEGMETSSYY